MARATKLLLFINLVCISTDVIAQPVEKWDLRKCVEYALQHNISIRQQDIQVKIDELTYRQSEHSKYPNLNFTSNLGISTGRSIDRSTNQFTTESVLYNQFSLQSNVDLFNWFSKRNTIAGNKLNYEASQAFADKTRNDIALNVAAAYLQTLLANEQINVSRVQIDQTRALLSNTEKLVKAGTLPELNLVELEAQLARDSSTYISATGTRAQSLLLLKALLNLDASVPFDIVTPPIEKIPVEPIADLQPEHVYQMALANLPQQRVATLRLAAARKFADAARGSMYPSIGLSGSLGTTYSNAKNNAEFLGFSGFSPIGVVQATGDTVIAPKSNLRFFAPPYRTQLSDNFNSGIGVMVSIPIFNGRSARTNWEKQKLYVQNLSLQKDLDSLSLKQDIYKAFTDAMTALQVFNAADKAVKSAERVLDFSQKRYDIGLLNTIDLITNQNNLFTARINRLSAQYDYVFKMKVLEFYKGMGIKL